MVCWKIVSGCNKAITRAMTVDVNNSVVSIVNPTHVSDGGKESVPGFEVKLVQAKHRVCEGKRMLTAKAKRRPLPGDASLPRRFLLPTLTIYSSACTTRDPPYTPYAPRIATKTRETRLVFSLYISDCATAHHGASLALPRA